MEGLEYYIGRGVVQNICLIGCKIQHIDGYVAVYLVLAIDIFDKASKVFLKLISYFR